MEEKRFIDILQYFNIHNLSGNGNVLQCVFGDFVLFFDRIEREVEVRTKSQEFVSYMNGMYDLVLENALIEGSFTDLEEKESVYYVKDDAGFIRFLSEMQLHNKKSIQDKLQSLKEVVCDFDDVLNPYGKLNYGAKPTDLYVSSIVYGSRIDIQMMESSNQNIRYYYNVDGSFSNEVFYHEEDTRIEVKHYSNGDEKSEYYGDNYLEFSYCDKNHNETRLIYNLSSGFGLDASNNVSIPLHSLSTETIDFIIRMVSSATNVATDIIQSKISKNVNVKK